MLPFTPHDIQYGCSGADSIASRVGEYVGLADGAGVDGAGALGSGAGFPFLLDGAGALGPDAGFLGIFDDGIIDGETFPGASD